MISLFSDKPIIDAFKEVADFILTTPFIDNADKKRLIQQEKELVRDIAPTMFLTGEQKARTYLYENYTL